MTRPEKITLGEMRASGVRGLLVYCSDYHCHWTAIGGDRWPDDMRLSDIEGGFVGTASDRRGAEVRPDFPPARMGIGQFQLAANLIIT
jgi:hypothetical protein